MDLVLAAPSGGNTLNPPSLAALGLRLRRGSSPRGEGPLATLERLALRLGLPLGPRLHPRALRPRRGRRDASRVFASVAGVRCCVVSASARPETRDRATGHDGLERLADADDGRSDLAAAGPAGEAAQGPVTLGQLGAPPVAAAGARAAPGLHAHHRRAHAERVEDAAVLVLVVALRTGTMRFESSGEARGSRVFKRKYALDTRFRLAEGGKKKAAGSSGGGARGVAPR